MTAIALLGNPNTGKSSLFSALTGARQRIANFPGVTVEAKLGICKLGERELTVIDLPGTYSLSARSPDERVAIEALYGRLPDIAKPDAIVVVLDASSLDRNCFLATQILELGIPTVVALSMIDVAENRGLTLDIPALASRLGAPVIPVNSPRGLGIDDLLEALGPALNAEPRPLDLPYPEGFRQAVEDLQKQLAGRSGELGYTPSWAEALRLLVDRDGPALDELEAAGGAEAIAALDALRATALGDARSLNMIEARARYGRIAEWMSACRRAEPSTGPTWTDRVDTILTHKLWGSLVFLVVMMLIFNSIYSWAGPLMDGVEGGIGALGGAVVELVPESMPTLRCLLEDGVIAGVGGVLVFLPQILILFLFIAILEDLGYMSRAAFLMDRIMARFGLSGRSFIPLLSSFACAIPGIMGARVIEDRNTRLTTIFMAPFMSCSARLPVYTLFIAAFIPQQTYLGFIELQGLVLFAMYSVGILFAIPTALVLKKGILKSAATPFLMELPTYKRPRVKAVARVLWDRGGAFVRRAGTIILAVSILVWALAYFPRDEATIAAFEERIAAAEKAPDAEERVAALENERDGALLARSYLGRMGRGIEPAVRPLGWDWRIGMAAIASFPAREVIVATLGTIFNLGADEDEESDSLRAVLKSAKDAEGRPLFTLATSLSIMVFFALCAQCAATLAVMRRETNSWRWPIASFAYMTALAYLASLVTYQAATALGA